jgi:phosphatidylglycerophosphate synthase
VPGTSSPLASVRASGLRALRAIAQPPEFSPSVTDRVYRLVSIFVSVPLARAGATPNGITLAWIALGVAGVGALLSGAWGIRLAGALGLQISYLLDYVDGEVARLTGRKSHTGEFLDLIGHGLIKTSLPLGVGAAAAWTTGVALYLGVGAVGAVAVIVGDSLRFYAACTTGELAGGDLGHVVRPRPGGRRVTIGKVLGLVFEQSFESPGLYGLTLIAAASDLFAPLALYWMVGAPIWLVRRARRYCRRLAADARPARHVPERVEAA